MSFLSVVIPSLEKQKIELSRAEKCWEPSQRAPQPVRGQQAGAPPPPRHPQHGRRQKHCPAECTGPWPNVVGPSASAAEHAWSPGARCWCRISDIGVCTGSNLGREQCTEVPRLSTLLQGHGQRCTARWKIWGPPFTRPRYHVNRSFNVTRAVSLQN